MELPTQVLPGQTLRTKMWRQAAQQAQSAPTRSSSRGHPMLQRPPACSASLTGCPTQCHSALSPSATPPFRLLLSRARGA
eukprot:scaffold109052_cov60-Phaeocystis_antarctica.AAC.3